MSKKGVKLDDLVEAVQDERVISVILARLSSDINNVIETMFSKLEAKFEATTRLTLERFAEDLVTKATSPLNLKISHLEEENKKLNQRVNDVETASRLNNLIVYGLPELPVNPPTHAEVVSHRPATKPNYDETTIAVELCRNRLGLEIDESDISYAHRISRGAKDKNRPILIGFTSRRARDLVFSAKKTLRTLPTSSNPERLYINEHLTKDNAHIYSMTRRLVREKKIHSTWSAGGLIFIRKTNSLSDKPARVASISNLDQLLHGGGIPLIATSPVQHDPSSSSSSSALIQVNPVEIHRFIHHHHSTSSSWNSISSSVAASSLAAAAAATEGGGGVTGGPSYDPLNQPPLQISTFDARDPGQDQASSQGQGHVMASFQQLLSSFGESDDDDTVVSLEETSAAAAAGLQGPLTPGLHPPPPPISIGRGTQPPASATASVALQASRVAMQRIARFSKDLHLRHPSRLSIHHHHHPHHHHQHQQQHHQSPPSLPPHLFNNASITNNSSSSSNFISTATHLIQQSGMKAFDTKC